MPIPAPSAVPTPAPTSTPSIEPTSSRSPWTLFVNYVLTAGVFISGPLFLIHWCCCRRKAGYTRIPARGAFGLPSVSAAAEHLPPTWPRRWPDPNRVNHEWTPVEEEEGVELEAHPGPSVGTYQWPPVVVVD